MCSSLCPRGCHARRGRSGPRRSSGVRGTQVPCRGVPCRAAAGCGMRDAGCGLRAAGCGLRAASREPRAASREPRAESCEPRAESREVRGGRPGPRAMGRKPRQARHARTRATGGSVGGPRKRAPLGGPPLSLEQPGTVRACPLANQAAIPYPLGVPIRTTTPPSPFSADGQWRSICS
ncbi:hypothetical protein BURMUCGD1_6043 [Burkholderia multivorans CGD1]|nr:hypothetical protein BURMUCGD1_6043 [Burkholderia multivorans CGD1]